MAQSMALARDNVMGCTLFDDADLHEWGKDQDITSRLLRAIGVGCAAEPGLNAWFDGTAQSRRTLEQIDVAIAVETFRQHDCGKLLPDARMRRARDLALRE